MCGSLWVSDKSKCPCRCILCICACSCVLMSIYAGIVCFCACLCYSCGLSTGVLCGAALIGGKAGESYCSPANPANQFCLISHCTLSPTSPPQRGGTLSYCVCQQWKASCGGICLTGTTHTSLPPLSLSCQSVGQTVPLPDNRVSFFFSCSVTDAHWRSLIMRFTHNQGLYKNMLCSYADYT